LAKILYKILKYFFYFRVIYSEIMYNFQLMCNFLTKPQLNQGGKL